LSYLVSHTFRDGTMRMVLSGSVAPGGVRAMADEIARIVQGEPVERLFIDVCDLREEIGPVETLNLIKEYPHDPRALRRRVAVLERPEQAYAHGFHETAAQNRGHSLRHFTDGAQAEAWLFSREL
jgi:hypothetical protein